MALLEKLDKKLHNWGIPYITVQIIIGQVLVFILTQTHQFSLEFFSFVPALVLRGEIWRLFTFVLLPPLTHPVFMIFAWYLFYLMGAALELYWGVFRYNLFLLIAYLATILAAFLTPYGVATNAYIGGSVFLAFAFLNPNFELALFFILPIKIKWLALLTWLQYGFTLLFASTWTPRLLVLASISNFLLFFGRDVLLMVRSRRWLMERKAREFAAQNNPIHRCTTCGITDKTDPTMEFRYCTKCRGTLCYCQNHIKNHEHVS